MLGERTRLGLREMPDADCVCVFSYNRVGWSAKICCRAKAGGTATILELDVPFLSTMVRCAAKVLSTVAVISLIVSRGRDKRGLDTRPFLGVGGNSGKDSSRIPESVLVTTNIGRCTKPCRRKSMLGLKSRRANKSNCTPIPGINCNSSILRILKGS